MTMTYVEESINLAIEGGYHPSDETDYRIETDPFGKCTLVYFSAAYPMEGEDAYEQDSIFLDPLFWQSLGKSLDWCDTCIHCGNTIIHGTKDANTADGAGEWHSSCKECGADWLDKAEFKEGNAVKGWIYQWHRFIDHLAEGKSAESFFESLINVKG